MLRRDHVRRGNGLHGGDMRDVRRPRSAVLSRQHVRRRTDVSVRNVWRVRCRRPGLLWRLELRHGRLQRGNVRRVRRRRSALLPRIRVRCRHHVRVGRVRIMRRGGPAMLRRSVQRDRDLSERHVQRMRRHGRALLHEQRLLRRLRGRDLLLRHLPALRRAPRAVLRPERLQQRRDVQPRPLRVRRARPGLLWPRDVQRRHPLQLDVRSMPLRSPQLSVLSGRRVRRRQQLPGHGHLRSRLSVRHQRASLLQRHHL